MYGQYPWKFGRPSSNDMSVLTKRAQIFRAQKVLFRKYGSYIGLPWEKNFDFFFRRRSSQNVLKRRKMQKNQNFRNFSKFFSYQKRASDRKNVDFFFVFFGVLEHSKTCRYALGKVIWALPPNCIKQGVYAHSKRQCAKLEHAAACSIRLWVTHHKWWGSGFCRWTIYSWFNPTTSPWIAIVPHILCKVYTHHCGTVARYTNLKVIWALPPNCIKQGVYAHSKRQCAKLEHAAACSIRLWVTHHQWWGSGFCRWTIYSWFNPTTSPWIAIVPHILCKVYTHHCGTVARYTNLKVIWALPPDCIKQGVYAHSKRQCAKLEHAAACSIRLWVTHHQWWGSGFCRWTIYSWFNPTTSPWIAIVPHILCKVYTHHCGTVARYTNLKVNSPTMVCVYFA